ncbi:MAG TPA: F0F1 ATP synthase subunit A [Pyrinomonadaceae bacterium]|jgi:F-type H+-transporting ATPase subunit a|nr:F0F1 ATP synthase subunit A [Pyrinomonadaceae bacterium]
MYWLLQASEKAEHAREAAEHAAPHAGGAEHHTPIIVQFVNHWLGEPALRFENSVTRPVWNKFFAYFHTTPEAAFTVPYNSETAIPWYTVMFVIACILSLILIWILRGQLSTEEPGHGQQTLEASVLAVRNMLEDIIGPHGLKYFPVVMTFAVLILVSNLMGFFPLFVSPTASVNVTFALGISSFVYYNYIGVKENGVFGHLKHFAGPIWWISPLIFIIEIIGNLIRPMSLGLRLFGNMFADEKVAENIANLLPGKTNWIVPVFLMPLGLFVAFIQTFVFVLLSMVYLSEVSHAPHDSHASHGEHGHADDEDAGEEFVVPVLT